MHLNYDLFLLWLGCLCTFYYITFELFRLV